jgi:hypothetical protein
MTAAQSGVQIVRLLHKAIKSKCPKLFEQMAALTDQRKRKDYQVAELITGALAMFLFKETSRNAFNNDRCEQFKSSYLKIFRLRLPHMDTVDDFLRKLPPFELENLKATLVSALIEQKVLHKFKLLGRHFTVAIDGTGVTSYEENDAEQTCSHKTSKNGKTTYSHYVVDAKLVTGSGFAISLASEWVANEPDRNFNKQDCEHKAFERLAQKLKKHFPRLPLCLLADGLYPNKTFLEVCRSNDWEFVVVLKDESLKKLQEDIKDVENKNRHSISTTDKRNKGNTNIERNYEWITEPLSHGQYTVHWLSCTETITCKDKEAKATTRFVYLTSMEVNKKNVRDIAQAGRNRWKIENEGFNTQKNGGYNLTHKYSRSTFACFKNYYQCLQIAHMINQLAEHSKSMTEMLDTNKKLTIISLWKNLISVLKMGIIQEKHLVITGRGQMRLAG